MNETVAMLLRLTLVIMGLGTLLAQFMTPALASEQAARYPEVAHLVVPYSIAAILGFVCVQTALVAVLRLLSMIEAAQIFDDRALKWVDTITGSAVVAACLSAGVLVHLALFEPTGGPGVPLVLVACVVGGAALALLMVVMRGLLTAAIVDRDELAEVI
ncbi:DUF2975 domain-containing protein [Oerskovia turbata]